MCERNSEGIIRVQAIDKSHEPTSHEAIYLITPSKKNVNEIVKDFRDENRPTYSAAHVHFTENCPEELLKSLVEKISGQYIKTLKSIDLSHPDDRHIYCFLN